MLTIIDEEFTEAREEFGTHENVLGTPFFIADLARVIAPDVVLAMADRANVAAFEATTELIEDFRPEVLLLVGIAGGLVDRGEIALGDVCVPKYVHYGEFRKLTEREDALRYEASDQPTVSIARCHVDPVRMKNDWAANISVTPPQSCAPLVRVGSIVAGEKVMGNPTHEEQRGLAHRFPDAIAVDMESWGVGRAVHAQRKAVPYNPRLAIIRGISDLVHTNETQESAEENNEQRKNWKRYAAAAAAAFANAVASGILATPDPRPERL